MNKNPKYTTFILLITQDKTTWVTMMNHINIHNHFKPISSANMQIEKDRAIEIMWL